MKRRDITLGDMQDECSFRGHMCETVGGEPCKYYGMCNQIRTKSCTPPEDWDLSDPPRFTEAQMALLKVFYDHGFRTVITGSTSDKLVDCVRDFLGVGENVKLDLAELFGKNAT